MIMKKIAVLLLFAIMNGCSWFSNEEIAPEDEYFRILNLHPDDSYEALDMKQTEDGGYIIIGQKQGSTPFGVYYNWNIYLLKLNRFGVPEWDTVFSDLYSEVVSPVVFAQEQYSDVKLQALNGKFYFPCIKTSGTNRLSTKHEVYKFSVETPLSLQKIISLDAQYNWSKLNQVDGALCYTYAKPTENNSLPLYAAKLNNNGGVIWTHQWEEDLGLELDVPRFISAQDIQIGDSNMIGLSYVYNLYFLTYTLKMLDPDRGTASVAPYISNCDGNICDTSFVSNFRYDTITPILLDDTRYLYNPPNYIGNIENKRLKISSLYFEEDQSEIMLPDMSLRIDTINAISKGSSVFSTREIDPNYPVFIQSLSHRGKNYLLYMGTTWNGRILMVSFQMDGEIKPVQKKYLGFNSFYEARSFVRTDDEGFAVLGTTYTAGRFSQLVLFKFSEENLRRWLLN
jgi:hypothetical protein